jgi:hypothetical protein
LIGVVARIIIDNERAYAVSSFVRITDVKGWPEMLDWPLNQNDQLLRAIHAVVGLETE